MHPLEDIKFKFKILLIEFEYERKLLTLQGIQPKLKAARPKALEKVDWKNLTFFMVKVRGSKRYKVDRKNSRFFNNGNECCKR